MDHSSMWSKHNLIAIVSVCVMCTLQSLSVFGQSLFDPTDFHMLEFAHRGGYHNTAENDIDVIVSNIRRGDLNAIEVDLMMTKDSVLVLFHDDTVNRVLQFERPYKVEHMTYDQLASKGFRKRGFETSHVSRFDDLVDTLVYLAAVEQRRFVIELDFKAQEYQIGPAVRQLLKAVNRTEAAYDKAIYDYFFVSSFYPGVLKAIRSKSDDIKLAFSFHAHSDEHKLKARLAAFLSGHFMRKYEAEIIESNMCYVTQKRVDKWKDNDWLVNTYTSNLACERKRMKELGVALTTNCPMSMDCMHDPSDMYVPKKWCTECPAETED